MSVQVKLELLLLGAGADRKRVLPAVSCPSSLRHADLRLPLRSGGPGRPGLDLPQGPVHGQQSDLPPPSGGGAEPDAPPGAPDEEAGRTRPPVHLPGSPEALCSSVPILSVPAASPQIPPNLPCSVTLQPGPEDTGKVSSCSAAALQLLPGRLIFSVFRPAGSISR